MSDKYCCTTWSESLAEEVREQKLAEIATIIKNKGIPKSVFASVIKVLNNIHHNCPVCGSGLSEEAKKQEEYVPKKVASPPQRTQPTPTPENTRSFVTCPDPKKTGGLSCGGSGFVGGGSSGAKCMSCGGTGKIQVKKKISSDKMAKLEELRANVKSADPSEVKKMTDNI